MPLKVPKALFTNNSLIKVRLYSLVLNNIIGRI
jgi:hypothetical protein